MTPEDTVAQAGDEVGDEAKAEIAARTARGRRRLAVARALPATQLDDSAEAEKKKDCRGGSEQHNVFKARPVASHTRTAALCLSSVAELA